MSYVVANAFFELGDVGQWSQLKSKYAIETTK